MAPARGFRLSSFVGLIVVPVLINLATGGLPDNWSLWDWTFSGAAVVVAVLLVVRQPPPPRPPLSLEAVVTNLALAVKAQWAEEFSVRGLNTPDPLPITWLPVDDKAVPPTKASAKGSARQRKRQQRRRASDPDVSSRDLNDIRRQTSTGRLLVLGGIGTGKTVALVRLVLSLLEWRRAAPWTEPVPVMYSLASWDPASTGLYEWLEAQLTNDHPMLRELSSQGKTWAQEIIANDLVLPVLDGFDELPPELRGAARHQLNTQLKKHPGLVLSCRTEDYRAMVEREDGKHELLHGTAAVEIQALHLDPVRKYLSEDARDDSRWAAVFRAAATSSALLGVFSTPLQVSLARTIYNPRLGEPAGSLPHPDELVDTERFPDQATVERHLFAGFLTAAYRRYPGQMRPPVCSAEQATRWLSSLARWMEHRPVPDEPGRTRRVIDLAWWELRDWAGPVIVGLSIGLPPALSVGLVAYLGEQLGMGLGLGVIVALIVVFLPVHGRGGRLTRRPDTLLALARPRRDGIVSGLAGGFVGGFLGGLTGGLIAHSMNGAPSAAGVMGGLGAGIGAGAIGGPWRGFAGGFVGGVAVGLTAGTGAGTAAGLVDGVAAWLAAGATVTLTGLRRPAREVKALHYSKVGLLVGLTVALAIGAVVWIRTGPQLGLISGFVVGILGGLAAGLEGTTVDPTRVAGPTPVLRRDRGTFLMIGTLGGLAFGLGAAFGVRPSVGVAAGITVGLVAACVQTSYGAFVTARFWLALSGRTPWKLMNFLDDAHRLGVLRQVGAVYQFRHIELQRHLGHTS